jgi:hypothetical protein
MEIGALAMGRWKYFFGASILAVALLLKAGAPLLPLVLGLAAAALFTWKMAARPPRQPPR